MPNRRTSHEEPTKPGNTMFLVMLEINSSLPVFPCGDMMLQLRGNLGLFAFQPQIRRRHRL
jgi:hypothetical protein